MPSPRLRRVDTPLLFLPDHYSMCVTDVFSGYFCYLAILKINFYYSYHGFFWDGTCMYVLLLPLVNSTSSYHWFQFDSFPLISGYHWFRDMDFSLLGYLVTSGYPLIA